MNLIALVEYGKRLNRAITAHDAALDYQLKLVNTISRHRGRIELDDDAMAERLGGYVQAMRDSVTAANRLYRRLLTTHPNAPHLGAIYARFCTDLMNDEQLAAQFSTDETGTANGSQAGSKAGSAHGSKLGSDARFSGKHTVGSSRMGVSLRTYVGRNARTEGVRVPCWHCEPTLTIVLHLQLHAQDPHEGGVFLGDAVPCRHGGAADHRRRHLRDHSRSADDDVK